MNQYVILDLYMGVLVNERFAVDWFNNANMMYFTKKSTYSPIGGTVLGLHT